MKKEMEANTSRPFKTQERKMVSEIQSKVTKQPKFQKIIAKM